MQHGEVVGAEALVHGAQDLLDARRLLCRQAARTDGLRHLLDRCHGDLLPGWEALTQPGEGTMRVDIGGVLREDGGDQAAERIAALIRLRVAIGAEQALAHGVDVLPPVAQERTQVGSDAGQVVWSGRTDGHGRSLYTCILGWIMRSVAPRHDKGTMTMRLTSRIYLVGSGWYGF